MYFESHAHYNDKRFKDDQHDLITKLFNEDISYIVNIGTEVNSCRTSLDLAVKYENMFTTVGVHPHSIATLTEEDLKKLKLYAKNNKVVAVGEIGLDYFYNFAPRDIQKYWFEKQLDMAKELNLPVVIHSRDACQECLDIIKASNIRKGVIHCFSSSVEIAREYVKLGFHLGIGGVVTFKNSKKLVEVVSETPLQHLLIETDSPYLAPVPNRGERNDSSNLKYIVQKIADIKNISIDEVANATLKNGKELFNINN